MLYILGKILPQRYRKQRIYSHSSMGWLTWRETEMKVEMRHARHPLGEKYLHDAHVWADGYVEETKLVLNYARCGTVCIGALAAGTIPDHQK